MLSALILLSALPPSSALPPASGLGHPVEWNVCPIDYPVVPRCCTPQYGGRLFTNAYPETVAPADETDPLLNLYCEFDSAKRAAYKQCIRRHTRGRGKGLEPCLSKPDELIPLPLPMTFPLPIPGTIRTVTMHQTRIPTAKPTVTLIARQAETPERVCGILPGVAKLCCTPEFQGELLVNPNASAPLWNLFCRVPPDQEDAYQDCIAEHTEPDGIGSEGCYGSPELLEPTTLPESIAAVGTTEGVSETGSVATSASASASGNVASSTANVTSAGTTASGSSTVAGATATPSSTTGASTSATGVTSSVSASPSATVEGNEGTTHASGPLAVFAALGLALALVM